MTLNLLQTSGLLLVTVLLLLAIPATLYCLKIVHTTSYPLLIRKKYVFLSLLTCKFCFLWLICLPLLITLWTFNNELHLNKYSVSLISQCTDIFVNNGISWTLVSRYWMLFFYSNWTSVTQQYIWIHIRGPTKRNPRGFLDISHLFWIKYQSLGRYGTVKRCMIYMLLFLFLILLSALSLLVYDCISLNAFHSLCFGLHIKPLILIVLLWLKTPLYEDNIGFRTQMRQLIFIVLILSTFRLIVYIYGFCFGFDIVYYVLYICIALITIFSIICSQLHNIQSDVKQIESQHDLMDTDIITDILRYILKSDKLTQQFILYLAKDFCLEYIFAFVELTQFRHLLERIYMVHEPLPESYFAKTYGKIDLAACIPRSSIVHNRKYSRYIRKETRIGKIAMKLIKKYLNSDSIFALYIDSDKISEYSAFQKWDLLLVQLEICRAKIYDILKHSVWRLCEFQKFNPIQMHMNIDIDFVEEFISNDWVKAVDIEHMTMDTAVVYEQLMASFPMGFKLLKLFKIKKNFESNLTIYKSILDTLSNQTERILFHGTSIENIKRIICDGFNPDYNVRSVYGKGTYFATDSKLAAKYCVKDVDSECYIMLICRVIVGYFTVGHRPNEGDRDCIPYQCDNVTQYDSLVDDLLYPTIFVINGDYRAIPEYMVVFEK